MKINASVAIDGTLGLSQIPNATTDTDKFLVSDGGIINYRTGAEMLSDLGIAPGVASNLQHQVKAGVAINKGQAVYVTSADGTNMIVGLASNTAESTSSKTMGLLGATVAINGFANVITEGLLAGLNTIGATAGDPVWLGTGGNLIYGLINKPYAPAHLVYIGVVTRVNANNGEIFVSVQNGFELDEIHDVDLKTTIPVNGNVLGFNGTLWVNKTIAGWLGYVPANDANVVHKTFDETIDGSKTFLKDLKVNSITIGRGGGNSIENTVLGYRALEINNTGIGIIAIGNEALANNQLGNFNTAIGEGALKANVSTSELTAIGYSALQLNTNGQENTAVGAYALNINSFGNNNTALGFKALVSNTLASSNTAIGSRTLSDNAGGTFNTAVGANALALNIGGSDNTAVGMQALFQVLNGTDNTAVGSNSLRGNLASGNTALGAYALSENTTGAKNTAMGFYALHVNSAGSHNVAIGDESLRETNGSFNAAVGGQTLTNNTTGSSNMAFGYNALFNNSIGANNIAIGMGALFENLTGSGNIGIGLGAFDTYKLGVNNIGIGSTVEVAALGDNNSIVIGANAVGLGSNTTVLGNDLTDKTFIRGRITLGSGVDNGIDRLQVNGYTLSDGYKIPGGQITWFLKADGSYDTNTYAIANAYLPLVGGTLTGPLTINGTGSRPVIIDSNVNIKGNTGGWAIQHGFIGSLGTVKGGFGALGFEDALTYYYIGDFGAEKLKIDHTSSAATFLGSVTATGFFSSSDSKLKNIIKRDGDTIKFKWKDKRDNKVHIGYIAQEVKKKYPDQVNKGDDGLLTVNYIEVLVAKIQELENRIKILENVN